MIISIILALRRQRKEQEESEGIQDKRAEVNKHYGHRGHLNAIETATSANDTSATGLKRKAGMMEPLDISKGKDLQDEFDRCDKMGYIDNVLFIIRYSFVVLLL